ncbi:MAG: hypothetical protein QF613_02845 [Candidatus Marinimicrobia bacterium]|jgi:hypothetical protein|nr:hypothetical protein [Candidatus Neomarinimicrobiota bacterium]MDP6593131.1 hypothetical protein [Candidatus Neomarinimicrobiota bacterium]MDP6837095.1 hypothetical protein [Candidatus Neomarinimicrobiota bacterium]|tara:strand:+ start:4390 stop:4587 length:198 start_codon:yes stop_codon:yes gene_type:complete
MLRIVTVSILLASTVAGQHTVGDSVKNFTAPYCFAESDSFKLSDYFMDEDNGKYYVLWFNLFTSW